MQRGATERKYCFANYIYIYAHDFVRKRYEENEETDRFSQIIDEINVKLKELEKPAKDIINSERSSVHEEHIEQYNKSWRATANYAVPRVLSRTNTEFK